MCRKQLHPCFEQDAARIYANHSKSNLTARTDIFIITRILGVINMMKERRIAFFYLE